MSSKLSSEYQEGSFLLDAVTELMTTLDLDLRIRWANLAAGKSVNEDPEKLVGRYCYQVWHGRKSPCKNCPVQGTIKTGEPQEDEVATPDGRYWHIRSYPLRSSEGILEGVAELTLEITDRKRAEEKRNYEIEHQQILLDNIQTQVWYQIDEQTYGAVNKAHAEFQGLTPEDMSFQDLFDLYPEDVAEICRQGNIEVFSKGQPVSTEEWVPHASGEWRLLSIHKTPKLRADGTVEYVVCSAEDITNRKQTEEALQESEKRFRDIFNNSSEAIFILDTNGRILEVNDVACERLLYSRQELSMMSAFDVDTFEPAKMVPERIRHLHQEGQICFETTHQRKDGYRIPVEVTSRLIEYEGETSILNTVRDISERKQTEEKLQRYRYLLEKSQEIAHVGSWELDVFSRRLIWSDESYRIFGLTPQESEMTEKTFLDFVHPEDRDYVYSAYNESMRKNMDTFEIEHRIIRCPDKNIRTLYNKCYHLKNNAGSIVKSIGMIQDITERKQMEQKLRELSLHDPLTGLYNRNFFEEEMTRLDDGRSNPVGIMVCDLDGLKFINDTLGHQFGDQVLLTTAYILRRSFRSSDIIARIGGDEFAILLTETEPWMVEQIQQRLRQAVQDYNSTNPDIPLSLSLGLALSEGETVDMEALFRQADNRMYREKVQREGSARSVVFQVLKESMQARDFDTEGHCERLQELTASLARSLDLSQDFLNNLSLLARFHDLGKVGISDRILFKPGPLTEEEWQEMWHHCGIGHRIASSVPDLEPIADWILKHHEWWDGRGYPLGLSSHDIPLPCRILAIADAYDAMTSDRPYRKAMTREEAITELRRCAGTQFDPELVEQFIQILEQNGS